MPRTSRSAAASARRSSCPVACSLDLLGDRWTLLVIRDLVGGKSRYGEFLESAEGIPTNVLAERLARLEDAGLIASTPYQQNPPRYAYSLTQKGEELKPVLGALASWGVRHLPKTQPSDKMLSVLRSYSDAAKPAQRK
jgi:DNA-binding HxlR family transcriptional regulator